MASPHAVGVAALIVSQYGRADHKNGGLTLDPSVTERILKTTAVEHPCPSPRTFTWHRVRSTEPFTVDNSATCAGSLCAQRLLRQRDRQRVRRGDRPLVAATPLSTRATCWPASVRWQGAAVSRGPLSGGGLRHPEGLASSSARIR